MRPENRAVQRCVDVPVTQTNGALSIGVVSGLPWGMQCVVIVAIALAAVVLRQRWWNSTLLLYLRAYVSFIFLTTRCFWIFTEKCAFHKICDLLL